MAARAPPASLLAAVRRLGDPRARPDGAWVSRLTGVPISEVWQTMRGIEIHEDLLSSVHERHRSRGREMYAQIRAPFELYTLTRLLRPDAIVETGVSSGVSSLHFLLGLADNDHGALHSVDLPTRQHGAVLREDESPVSLPPGEETGWVVPVSLRGRWSLHLGPSQELLPKVVADLPSVGIFLHDSLHTAQHLAFELGTVRPHLGRGAMVLADNTSWTGKAFDRFADAVGAPAIRRGRTDLVGLRVPVGSTPAIGRERTPRSRAPR